jgi:hypothetical protein
MKTATKMRRLIEEESTAINNFIDGSNRQLQVLNEIIFEILEKGIVCNVELDFLKQVVKDPDKRIARVYMDKIPAIDTVTGLPVDKAKHIESLKLPDLTKIKQAAFALDYSGNNAFFNLIDIMDNKARLSEERLEQYIDREYRSYVHGEDACALWEDLNQAAGILAKWHSRLNIIKKDAGTGKAQIDWLMVGSHFGSTEQYCKLNLAEFKKLTSRL